MADATYHFLSFVRRGFAASITQPDTFGSGQRALATATVGVSVSGVSQPPHNAVVRGPGDVIGIAASQVVRTDPVDGAVGVEPNYFAHVEFDRPELPWLFTPSAAVGERLRPWIVLVVVDLEGPQACALTNGSPLPQLHVPVEAAGQLPDLDSSYLWAHGQVLAPDGQQPKDVVDGGDPRLTVSRLMCPRHLDPFAWYLAAVVPAFNVGRLAGLGLDVKPEDEAKLDPAWQPGGAVVLPVYYSFRFRTGEDADFEALARRLQGRPLPPGVGTRPLDVSRPGAGLPSLPQPADIHDAKAIVWLDGALRPIDSDSLPKRDPAAEQTFRTNLTVLLDKPAEYVRSGDADPVVAPPIYGDKHALVVELGQGTPPPWISELNLDIKTRVAAGLGTQVVQLRQEDLVARAWRQLGDVLAANRILRAAQFARTASLRVHDRLSTLDSGTLVAVSAPAHDRVAGFAGAAVTAAKAIRDSRLPDVAVDTAFRRLARPAALVARTAGVAALGDTVVTRFAADVFAAPVGGPDGVSSMRPATEVIGPDRATAALAAIGDAEPGDPTRLDTALTTLAGNAHALPTGDEIRAGTPRNDVGAVSLVASLGAVRASAVSALLDAAASAPPAQPPPVQPPPVQPPPMHVPPIHLPPIGPLHPSHGGVVQSLVTHVPVGLTGPISTDVPVAVGLRPVAVFQPPGVEHNLGGGIVVRGGTVVIATETVGWIAAGTTNVTRIDDARWTTLKETSNIPTAVASADPVTDPGARLDAIRRDPSAIAALAQVATGQIDATVALDNVVADLATTGAGRTSFESLATGAFAVPLPHVVAAVTGPADLDATKEIIGSVAAGFDRVVTEADAPTAPPGPVLDLAAARSGLLAKFDPEVTIAARVQFRLDVRTIRGVVPRDDLDPVMGCPQFLDSMWEGVRDLGHGWLLPGLELVPPDTATLVRTNPAFVSSHLVGLNHEFMRELLWREYPTDLRGTAFKRFWGRSGAQPDDIGPVHLFGNNELAETLLVGKEGEGVLLLRSELLRRYPGSIVYLCRAKQVGNDLFLDDDTIIVPTFRGDLPPDVTFVGFPITPETLRGNGDPWWFVIAQPPAEPRFGLDDASKEMPAVPTSSNDLAWPHMSPDPPNNAPAPFAIADPPTLNGKLVDGLTWGDSAAVQAHLTYQHPVRVAIRAADLLPPPTPPPPSPPPP
jgi:hypothetical protein